MNSEIMAAKLRKKMIAYYKNNDYTRASEVGHRLIQSYHMSYTFKDQNYADDLYNVGLIHHRLGNYDKAMAFYTKSYEAILNSLGQSMELIKPLTNLAIVCSEQGNMKEAVAIHARVIEMLENLNKKDTVHYAEGLYNLGNTYAQMGNFDEALKQLNAAEQYYERTHDVDTVDTYNSIGYILQELKDYKGAIYYLEKALDLLRKLHDDKEELARNAYYLANLCQSSQDYKKAFIYYREALLLIRNYSGGAIPYYPSCLNNLASVLDKMGEPEKSIHLRLEAMEQVKNAIGQSHMYYANSLRSLASTYKTIQEYEKAQKLMLEAIEIKRNLVGECCKEYIQDLLLLIDLYVLGQHKDKALELILSIIDELGNDFAGFEQIIQELAKLYMSLGDLNQLNDIYNGVVERYTSGMENET